MAVELPEDILYLVCAELRKRRDFGTLFNCCTAGKALAVPAIAGLYWVQEAIKADSSDETVSLADQELVVQKWSILWRSMILSAFGKTVLPYCKYIRVLDLDDLKQLLEEERFKGIISSNFFSGALSKFNIPLDTPSKTRSRLARLDVGSIINAVADLLTGKSPMLEALNGPVLQRGPPIAIVRWIHRLPNLRSLKVSDGQVLGDDRVPGLLNAHCPKFESLAIYSWVTPDCDQKLSALFSGLPEGTLRSFTTFSRTSFGPESCLTLNRHGKSLRTLELQLDNDVIPHLGFLRGCAALESLKLNDYLKTIDLEATQHDVFLEVIAWLLECRELHTLTLSGFISGAAIATPVLLDERIRLEQLEIDNYATKDQNKFHHALAHQTTLQRLTLDTEPIETRDELDILLYSICQLKQLRSLKLIGVSAMFSDHHINAIAENLEFLEDLYVGGLGLSDTSLESIASLTNLRSVAFSGITTFTMEGLLAFIERLGDGNKGLVLAIDSADPESGLSQEEQAYVRQAIMEQIDGRLEYTFWRDPDISDFEGEESD